MKDSKKKAFWPKRSVLIALIVFLLLFGSCYALLSGEITTDDVPVWDVKDYMK